MFSKSVRSLNSSVIYLSILCIKFYYLKDLESVPPFWLTIPGHQTLTRVFEYFFFKISSLSQPHEVTLALQFIETEAYNQEKAFLWKKFLIEPTSLGLKNRKSQVSPKALYPRFNVLYGGTHPSVGMHIAPGTSSVATPSSAVSPGWWPMWWTLNDKGQPWPAHSHRSVCWMSERISGGFDEAYRGWSPRPLPVMESFITSLELCWSLGWCGFVTAESCCLWSFC